MPGVATVLVAIAWRPLLFGAGPLFPFAAEPERGRLVGLVTRRGLLQVRAATVRGEGERGRPIPMPSGLRGRRSAGAT